MPKSDSAGPPKRVSAQVKVHRGDDTPGYRSCGGCVVKQINSFWGMHQAVGGNLSSPTTVVLQWKAWVLTTRTAGSPKQTNARA